jgi:hypothetical protein
MHTTCSAAKWRQQQAYMIQSSYSEGSAIKRNTIDAYLMKNCYIQVLQPVGKLSPAAVAAVEAAHSARAAACDTIMDNVTVDKINSLMMNKKKPKSSIGNR